MAFEAGGYADKQGNKYESLWIARQYIKLIQEKVSSITVEAIGPDEEGVDLIIEEQCGKRIFHQCKARNGSSEYWRINDLASRKILTNCKKHLDRSPEYEFKLISGIPAKGLGDICSSARLSNDNATDFYTYQIERCGAYRLNLFDEFCNIFGLRSSSVFDRKQAFNYLKRIEFICWDFDSEHIEELHAMCSLLIAADSGALISEFRRFAEENIRKVISAITLKEHLNSNGYQYRILEKDGRVIPAIEKLQNKFIDGIKEVLINGELIPRKESAKLLERYKEDNIIIIHGDAGRGKSGVLYEFLSELKKRNVPCVPIRLDRQNIGHNLAECSSKLELPETPAISVKSLLLDNEQGVIIIDQLDALRWTTGHSATALEVCKDIVREAITLHLLGSKVCVVLACRTFDYKNDPTLKSWLSGDHFKSIIEVNDLSESITDVLSHFNLPVDNLSNEQKKIIASPHMLKIWFDLHNKGKQFSFNTSSSLLQFFFDHVHLEIEKKGHAGDKIFKELNSIIDFMDSKCRLTAPASVIQDRKIFTELRSLNILTTTNDESQLIFCHQSFLDFLIARNLISKVFSNQETFGEWLKVPERQTLLYRERLKLALSLLKDQDPIEFDNQCCIILSSTIRFHLKHLTLQVIGSSQDISDNMMIQLVELCNNEYWAGHIFFNIFNQNITTVFWLKDKQYLSKWFDDKSKRRHVLLLFAVYKTEMSDVIYNVFHPIIDNSIETANELLYILNFQRDYESDKLFELRQRILIIHGLAGIISWQALSKDNSKRTIDYLLALAIRSIEGEKTSNRADTIYRMDIKLIRKSARSTPIFTWESLIPYVIKETNFKLRNPFYDPRLDSWEESSESSKYHYNRAILEVLIIAGREIAKKYPDYFWEYISSIKNCHSYILKEIIIKALPKLDKNFANRAIEWLLSDSQNMCLELNRNQKKWLYVSQIIKKQSPYCSDSCFVKLENTLYYYFNPKDKQLCKECTGEWRKDFFNYMWGKPQLFYLPALDPRRRSQKTNNLIEVLKRKFSNYLFSDSSYKGGRITSTISGKEDILSNANWLKIINNKKLKQVDRHSTWRQVNEGTVEESSVSQFSNSLRKAAEANPARFGGFALSLPDDVNTCYISAILQGISQATPPDTWEKNNKTPWQPCPVSIIKSFFDKYYLSNNSRLKERRDIAISFCRMIERRSEEEWPEKFVDLLVEFALEHHDPIDNCLSVHCDIEASKASPDILYTNTYNCVRGIAIRAISKLIWNNNDILDKILPHIDRILEDPHPVVRLASLEIILPVMNIDRPIAISWFTKICHGDLRIAATRQAIQVFNCAAQEFYHEFRNLVINMAYSNIPEVAEHGASEITARYLFNGQYESEIDAIQTGNISQRKGVAAVAAYAFSNEKYSHKCSIFLKALLNDTEKDVRDKAAHGNHSAGTRLLTG